MCEEEGGGGRGRGMGMREEEEGGVVGVQTVNVHVSLCPVWVSSSSVVDQHTTNIAYAGC